MKISVSKRANHDFLRIQDYLLTNWGDSSVLKFKNQVNDFLDILEIFPGLDSNSQTPGTASPLSPTSILLKIKSRPVFQDEFQTKNYYLKKVKKLKSKS